MLPLSSGGSGIDDLASSVRYRKDSRVWNLLCSRHLSLGILRSRDELEGCNAYGLVLGLAMALMWSRKMRQLFVEDNAQTVVVPHGVWVGAAAQTIILVGLLWVEDTVARAILTSLFVGLGILIWVRLRDQL
jgi:hypothetical protein